MQNTNYILIGISILTISCIYLFYLNFSKDNKEAQYVSKIRNMKYTQDNMSEDLVKIKKLLTYNSSNLEMLKKVVFQINPEHFRDKEQIELSNLDQNNRNTHNLGYNTPDENAEREPANINDDVEDVDDEDVDDEDVDDEDVDIDMEDVDIENIDIEDVDDVNVDEVTDEEDADSEDNGAEDIDFDDMSNNELDLTEADISNIEKLTDTGITDLDNLSDIGDDNLLNEIIQLKEDNNTDNTPNDESINTPIRIKVEKQNGKPTEEELNSSTVKELKVIAKNFGVSARGNKDELVARILVKTKQNGLDSFM